MREPVADSGLELPRGVAEVGVVPPPGGGLVRADRPGGTGTLLAGARSTARAGALGGLEAVDADGRPLLTAVRVDAPPAANVLTTPRTRAAERIGAGGSLHETVVVPERLPGVVVQWTAPGSLAPLRLDVDLAAPAIATRVHVRDGLLRWAAPDDPSGGVLQVVGGGGAAWTVAATVDGLRATARVRLEPGSPATLLAAAVGPDGRLPALGALAGVAAHRRRDDLEPDEAPGLRLGTGVADLDEGTAWARAALRGRLAEGRSGPTVRGDQAALLARGALASGEIAVARAALSSSLPGIADAEARAEWVAWTGRGDLLLEARRRLDPVLASADPALRRRVADAAEAAGDAGWAAELRVPPPRGGRVLPSLGAAPRGEAPRSLAPDPELAGLRGFAPEADAALLRSEVEALRRGDSGLLDDVAPRVLLRLVRGLMGVDPDAAYGRVGIAPWLPEHWTTFRADGLRVGDATLAVEYRREAMLHRFVLRQTGGGAPVTWILAPRLPGVGLTAARVDGMDAEVDAAPWGTRVCPRIQLPAEGERVVEFEVALSAP